MVKLRTILYGKCAMSYYVYVIKSVNSNYTYTWMTNNIERRLEEHNLWKTKSNKNYKPFKLYAGMVELVDTLGLEPSALRCAGSSPVPGN